MSTHELPAIITDGTSIIPGYLSLCRTLVLKVCSTWSWGQGEAASELERIYAPPRKTRSGESKLVCWLESRRVKKPISDSLAEIHHEVVVFGQVLVLPSQSQLPQGYAVSLV